MYFVHCILLILAIDPKNIPLKCNVCKNLRAYNAYQVESKSKDKHTGTKISFKSQQVISYIHMVISSKHAETGISLEIL